jgi:uncharacterized protein (TIGR00730 family)
MVLSLNQVLAMIKNITVFCSSSRSVDGAYVQAAHELGLAIAAQNWQLVYGGNHIGMMGTLADAVRSVGGRVVGITPQLLVDHGIADHKCDELVITANMRDRKALMEERGDAFIALPGGIGTYEEIIEIIVGRHLGMHHKPVILLNILDYYRPFLAMIEHGIARSFIKPRVRDAFYLAESVPQAIARLLSGNGDDSAPAPEAD